MKYVNDTKRVNIELIYHIRVKLMQIIERLIIAFVHKDHDYLFENVQVNIIIDKQNYY